MNRDLNTMLGEAPLWCEADQSWYFVDIINGCLYSEVLDHAKIVLSDLSYISNLVNAKHGFLITAENTIYFFNHKSKEVEKFYTINQPKTFRTNDGSVGPDGRYWFGTMEKNPSGLNGNLYSLDSYGTLVHQGEGIGIPNSFIWLDEELVLISDSFLQKTYKVELLDTGTLDWKNRKLWVDLSDTKGTPDGGALDIDGNIWLAIWGAGEVHKYSPFGKLLDKLLVKALQPTSCCFGGNDMDEIFITTATEGLSEQQLMQYPDSGRTLRRNVGVKGKKLPEFNIAE